MVYIKRTRKVNLEKEIVIEYSYSNQETLTKVGFHSIVK